MLATTAFWTSSGQRGGDAVRIDGGVVQPLGLEENLVPVALAEAHDLVLDRGAIARAPARDLPGIHRRAVHIRPDDVVGRLRGASDAALDLRRFDAFGQHRERLGRLVARLHFDCAPVDRGTVEPRRRAGFEPAERKAEPFQRQRKTNGGRLADTARRRLLLADMDQAAQEGAGGQHRGAAGDFAAVGQADARHTALADHQIVDLGLDHGQVRGLGERPLHRLGVELAVGLCTRAAHRRPLAAIEHAELDAGLVRHPGHQAVERVDLAHQMAFAEPADRRIARHRADGGEPVRDQRGSRAHAGGSGRRLAARVSTANDDNVEGNHGGFVLTQREFKQGFRVPRPRPNSERARIEFWPAKHVSRETFRPFILDFIILLRRRVLIEGRFLALERCILRPDQRVSIRYLGAVPRQSLQAYLRCPTAHLPMQKSRKMTSRISSTSTLPVRRPSARAASRSSSATSSSCCASIARPSASAHCRSASR